MAVTFPTYERVVLEDPDGIWELVCGKLHEKPPMTQAHNSLASRLVAQLVTQADDEQYEVRMNAPALRVREGTYRVPDVAVVPQLGLTSSSGIETYDAPLPLVVEVWSPSTGGTDGGEKIPEYQERGDLEIWRVHPRDRVITAWRKLPGGSYERSSHSEGAVPVLSLPNVSVDLRRLFR